MLDEAAATPTVAVLVPGLACHAAAQAGARLAVGMQLMEVGGVSVDGLDHEAATEIIRSNLERPLLLRLRVSTFVAEAELDMEPEPELVPEPEPEPARDPKVQNLMDMGFPNENVCRNALELSGGNVERALDLILAGDVPDTPPTPPPPKAPPSPPPRSGSAPEVCDTPGAPESSGFIDPETIPQRPVPFARTIFQRGALPRDPVSTYQPVCFL